MANRKNIMLGTAGHVDHGKTALVKLLTGCDTDRLPEEKRRGMTIELGFAPCQLANEGLVGIVDVPGHVDFIRNMVAGAHGMDGVIFVIAADDGVMPQTREHLEILTLLGVRRGLVALTKIDLIAPDLREMVIQDVRKFLTGTFLENEPICPLSNITGEGFDGLYQSINELVDRCPQRHCSGLFRLWVERSFSIRGFGTVVSGIPTAGEVRVGDHLLLQPGAQACRVRNLEVYGQQSEMGRAGECVAINIADVDAELASRGKVLCQGQSFQPATMVEAQLQLLSSLSGELKDYAEVHLHVGTAEVMAHVAMLEDHRLRPGQSAFVQLRLASPLSVAPGERFVIRHSMSGMAEGHLTTIGGGRILGASNVRLRRQRAWTMETLAGRLKALDDPRAWLDLVLAEQTQPLSLQALADLAALQAKQAQPLLDELRQQGHAVEIGEGKFFHQAALDRANGHVLEVLEQFHQGNPQRQGMEEAELLAGAELTPAIFHAAVSALLAQAKLTRRGTILGLAGKGPQMSSADAQACQSLEAALAAAGLAPPGAEELARSLNLPVKRFDAILRLLMDRGQVVRLDEKVVMHASALEAGKKVLLDLFRKAKSFETVEFRDALGVSRKYAVPMLDYFDKIRLTVRSGNRRTPGAEARKLLLPPPA